MIHIIHISLLHIHIYLLYIMDDCIHLWKCWNSVRTLCLLSTLSVMNHFLFQLMYVRSFPGPC